MNPEQLLDIGDNDEELIQELIDEFNKDAPVYLEALRTAVESGDQDRIVKIAHKFNGLVANFGGERFLEIGRKIENSARKEILNPDAGDFDILSAELEQLTQSLNETDWKELCD